MKYPELSRWPQSIHTCPDATRIIPERYLDDTRERLIATNEETHQIVVLGLYWGHDVKKVNERQMQGRKMRMAKRRRG